MKKIFYTEDSGSLLKIKSSESGEVMGSASYQIKDAPFRHLYLSCAAVRQKQCGHYSILFKEIEKVAKENDCKSLRSKTGATLEYSGVREIHRKYGFCTLPQTDLDKQKQRIGLEKQF